MGSPREVTVGELRKRAEVSDKTLAGAVADGKGIILQAIQNNRNKLSPDEAILFEQACLDAGFAAIDAALCRGLAGTMTVPLGSLMNRPAARPRLVS